MRFVRQSTAATVTVGPFIDKTDGVTAETGLADQSANGRLVKNGTGAAFTASSWAHDAQGNYLVGLSTSHTDTIGRLRLSFSDAATYCPVWEDFMVLDEAVYDVLFGTTAPSTHTAAAVQALVAAGAVASVTGNVGGNVVGSVGSVTAAVTVTGTPAVNVTQISGDSTAADNLEAALDGTGGVTITAALTGNVTGNLSGSVGSVTGAVGSVTGAVGSVTGNVGGNVAGSVASVTAAVTVGTINANVITATSIAANAITAAKVATDAIGAAQLAADAVSEIQSGLATAAALSTAAGYIDTEIAAIITTLGAAGAGLTAIPWNAAWDAEVQSEVADALGVYDPPTHAELTTALDALPTAAEVAAAVWDESLAAHLTGGSTGAGLNAAGSAGDPWSTALPGAYTAGSAGYILGTNLDAPVSGVGGGGGGDATAANQTTIIAHLTDIKGATFSGATDSLEAIRDRGDAAWTTATGFSTHSAADVWAAGTRTLTAGTNIVLAKGTGVTGFNDIAAADVWAVGARTITGGTITTYTGNTPQTGDAFARLGAPAGASVSADVAAVKVDTAAILVDTGTDGVVVAAASKSGYSLAAAGVDAVVIEGSTTLTESARLWNAALGGKASGLDTSTAVYRDLADSKSRITATVDADGNRTAVTRDLT
jgi:hypothetical protein